MGATISASTRLNKALDLHPDVLEYIVSLNPHDFVRLRNPVMRRLMSPRITLGRIAAMTHVPLAALLGRVASLGRATVVEDAAEQAPPQSPAEPPLWLADARPDEIAELNLLPMDATLDADPLPPVMHAVNGLAPGGILCIRHKWEPQPFYDMWSKIGGLDWYAAEISSDEWHIWVRRIASPESAR